MNRSLWNTIAITRKKKAKALPWIRERPNASFSFAFLTSWCMNSHSSSGQATAILWKIFAIFFCFVIDMSDILGYIEAVLHHEHPPPPISLVY